MEATGLSVGPELGEGAVTWRQAEGMVVRSRTSSSREATAGTTEASSGRGNFPCRHPYLSCNPAWLILPFPGPPDPPYWGLAPPPHLIGPALIQAFSSQRWTQSSLSSVLPPPPPPLPSTIIDHDPQAIQRFWARLGLPLRFLQCPARSLHAPPVSPRRPPLSC